MTGRARGIGRGLQALPTASPAPESGEYAPGAVLEVLDRRSLAEISRTVTESQAAPATRVSYGSVCCRLVALTGKAPAPRP
jgi:hypothetical protein